MHVLVLDFPGIHICIYTLEHRARQVSHSGSQALGKLVCWMHDKFPSWSVPGSRAASSSVNASSSQQTAQQCNEVSRLHRHPTSVGVTQLHSGLRCF